MLIDAYEPLGVTRLAVDSIFMMPHLGVLSTVHEQAATEVLLKDCLIPLGTCVAPSGRGKAGQPCFSYRLVQPDGQTLDGSLSCGSLERLSLADGREARLELSPRRGFDFGAGPGKALSAPVVGGTVGLVLDARGRPLSLAPDEAGRTAQLRAWQTALDLYPDSD